VCASGRLSCESGTSERASAGELETSAECCQQLCMAHGDPGRGVEPADVLNETETLEIVSVVSESPDGGGIPRVHLGSANWRAGSANGPGRETDGSRGQADGQRGWTDALNASNHTGTNEMSCGEGASTYLGARGAKRVVNATVGVGSHTDASDGHTDVPSVQTDALTTANETETVSIPRKREKPPDSPVEAAKQHSDEPNGSRNRADTSSVCRDAQSVGNGPETTTDAPQTVRKPQNESKTKNSPMETTRRRPDEPNGCGSRADGSSACTDVHSVGNATETAANGTETVRTRQTNEKTRNSPNGREIATPEVARRWRKVSIGGGDVYVPCNAPVEALGTANRRIVFGRVESGVEAIAPSLEGERAGHGDGDGYGDDGGDGDVGDTTSGGNSDSIRVEAALLAGDSQLKRQSRRIQTGNLPVSSVPPIQSERRPHGLIRHRRRRGRLKIERINVSQTKQVETTYLERTSATQPPGYDPNRAYGVYRPRRRRGRIKIATTNISRTRNGGNAYLGRDNAMRSLWRPKKQTRRVSKLTFESRMPGEPWRDDEDHG